MNLNDKICVSILAGGLSSRMGGGIKTFKTFNNKTIFERIFSKLNNQSKNIIVNTNEDHNLFSDYKATIVKDVFTDRIGPLGGLHASLKWLNSNRKNIDWLVSVPADTPFLPNNLVERLFKETIKNRNKIVMAKSNGKIHPIVGIWHSSLLKSLENDINLGTRKILNWAQKYSIGYVEFSNKEYDYFFNINYKEDILKAEEIENKLV